MKKADTNIHDHRLKKKSWKKERAMRPQCPLHVSACLPAWNF